MRVVYFIRLIVVIGCVYLGNVSNIKGQSFLRKPKVLSRPNLSSPSYGYTERLQSHWVISPDRLGVEVFKEADFSDEVSGIELDFESLYYALDETQAALLLSHPDGQSIGWVKKEDLILWDSPLYSTKFDQLLLALVRYSDLPVQLRTEGQNSNPTGIFYIYKVKNGQALVGRTNIFTEDAFWVSLESITVLDKRLGFKLNVQTQDSIPQSIAKLTESNSGELLNANQYLISGFPIKDCNESNDTCEIYVQDSGELRAVEININLDIMGLFITSGEKDLLFSHLRSISDSNSPDELSANLAKILGKDHEASDLEKIVFREIFKISTVFSTPFKNITLNQLTCLDQTDFLSIKNQFLKSFQIVKDKVTPDLIDGDGYFYWLSLEVIPFYKYYEQLEFETCDHIKDTHLNIFYLETSEDSSRIRAYQRHFAQVIDSLKNQSENSKALFVYNCDKNETQLCSGNKLDIHGHEFARWITATKPPAKYLETPLYIKDLLRRQIVFDSRFKGSISKISIYLMTEPAFHLNTHEPYFFGMERIVRDLSNELHQILKPESIKVFLFVDNEDEFGKGHISFVDDRIVLNPIKIER